VVVFGIVPKAAFGVVFGFRVIFRLGVASGVTLRVVVKAVINNVYMAVVVRAVSGAVVRNVYMVNFRVGMINSVFMVVAASGAAFGVILDVTFGFRVIFRLGVWSGVILRVVLRAVSKAVFENVYIVVLRAASSGNVYIVGVFRVAAGMWSRHVI